MRLRVAPITLSLIFLPLIGLGVEYPFTSVDISNHDVTPGTTTYNLSSDTYTVTTYGHDIWDREDDFRFLYVEMSRDFSVSIRVNAPQGLWPDPWTKAGIMIRQGLSAGSKDIYLVSTRDNGVAFQWRDRANFPALWTGTSEPPAPLTYPMWLRIVRSGDEFTGWYSEDGESWTHPPQYTRTLFMSDPVLVGVCLTSHLSGVPATATFGDVHIPELESSTVAIAPPDQIVREGKVVILDGSESWNTVGFRWEQVLVGDEPQVAINSFKRPTAWFIAPELDVAAILTFRLTVYSSTGKDSDLTRVAVKADNAPMVPPANLYSQPGDLSVTLFWDPMLDADYYVVKRAEQPPGSEKSPFQTIRPRVTGTTAVDQYLEEGTTYYYIVHAGNSFPPHEGPPSNQTSVAAMPNLALRPDTTPIARVTTPTGGGLKNLNAIMNGMTRESYDTFNDCATRNEDWFGYSWPQPLYFDHIVYYEGEHFENGGWWTNLTVQFSHDGITWKEAANVEIIPPYDFSDSPLGRRPYSRFDITFKPVKARYIRIHGSPGGIAAFTSIAELEVYGNQNRGPLTVYGVDRSVDEGQIAVLDASYSFSTRGPIILYRWVQTSGSPNVPLTDPDTPYASFSAPIVDQDTFLTFAITAGDGTDEETDEVQLVIRNLVTRANAGPDITALEGTPVQLDGMASVTTSGNLFCEWKQISGPLVTLSDAHLPLTSFDAPLIWQFSDDLVFQLRVDDGLGRPDSIGTDTVTVCVKNTLNTMPHLEKAGLVVIEAENYTSLNRHNDDRGTWQVFQGDPAYVEVPDIPSDRGTRDWDDAAQISYDIDIRHPGDYFLKLRRFVLHGAGRDGAKSNSCFVGMNGELAISGFDNEENYNRWAWAPSRESEFLHFPAPGTYSLDIRCREDGYRIDRIVLYQLGASYVPEDWSSEIGPPEDAPGLSIVCSRELGSHYSPDTTHPVSLHLDINTPLIVDSLRITEYFPPSFAVLDPAQGDTSIPGRLTWTFSADEIANCTLTYSLAIPPNTSGPGIFSGHLSYRDVENQPILGETVLYPLPVPPPSVSVEMLVAATVSWLPSPDDSVLAYRVYRSSDGRNWTDVSGPWPASPFVDFTVQPGASYIYRVCAENRAGAKSPLASCQATPPQPVPYTDVRETEDYNYAGGRFPGGPGAPAASEAASEDDLGSDVDYFFQSEPTTNSYRPRDPVDIRPGEGSSGWFMGYSTPGDWWRYSFQVPAAGYVKLIYRGTTTSGTATIEFFWDEKSIGQIDYTTPGGRQDWTYYSLEPFFSGPGPHVLRMQLVSGNANYDLLALAYDRELAGRKVIYGEDFAPYTETEDAESLGGWTIISSSSSPGAWQLWNTEDGALTPSSGEPGPDLPGMGGNYMISNGDFAPGIHLDEQLVSPEIDCSAYDTVTVGFSSHINIHEKDTHGDLQTTDFDISICDPVTQLWSDWVTIFTHDYSQGDQSSPLPLSFDISSLADGVKIRLRWHFYNTQYDFWWAIDNIVVSGRRSAKPGVVSMNVQSGDTLALAWERFGTGYYTVQYTDYLTNGSWTDAEGTAWPIIAATWTGDLPAAPRQRFYRVVSQ